MQAAAIRFSYGFTEAVPSMILFMPSLDLLRERCDKWIYDFPNDFSGIVGGYGLQRMHSQIMGGHRAISCMGTCRQAGQSRTEAVWRAHGNRAIMVVLPCSLRRFSTEMLLRSFGLSTGHAEMVR